MKHNTALSVQEAQDFWRQALEAVERPIARKLASQLDLPNPLGLPPAVAARRRGTRRQKAPLYPFHLQVKNKHSTKVVLVRVRAAALVLGALACSHQVGDHVNECDLPCTWVHTAKICSR